MPHKLENVKGQLLAFGERDYARFVLFGSLNTGMNFVLYSLCIVLGFNYMIANAISWVAGVTVSFLFNMRYVFKKIYQHKRLFLFAISNIVSLLVSMAMLSVLIKGLLMNPIAAAVIATPVVVIVNFTTSKFIVFSRES